MLLSFSNLHLFLLHIWIFIFGIFMQLLLQGIQLCLKINPFFYANILFMFFVVYYSGNTLNLNFVPIWSPRTSKGSEACPFSFYSSHPEHRVWCDWHLPRAVCSLVAHQGKGQSRQPFIQGWWGFFGTVQRLLPCEEVMQSCGKTEKLSLAVGALSWGNLLFHTCFCSTHGLFSAHPLFPCTAAW